MLHLNAIPHSTRLASIAKRTSACSPFESFFIQFVTHVPEKTQAREQKLRNVFAGLAWLGLAWAGLGPKCISFRPKATQLATTRYVSFATITDISRI